MRTGYLTAIFIFASIVCSGQSGSLFTLLPQKQTGIDFRNDISETEELNVLSYEYFYNGGGVAAGDINNDGLIDLYFTANMKPDKIFLNQGNLKFKDISRSSRIGNQSRWKTGVTMADVNGDGWLDIYVCYSGNGDTDSRRNKLFINNQDLTFTERAREFGLDDASYSTQAAFFDYDRDGDLDMYLLNHNIKDYKDVELPSIRLEYDSLAGDKLFRNDEGFFRDVSRDAGISGNPISFGLGVSISDINMDGWPDIYVSNDYREHDYLYVNNRNGTFKESSKECLQHMSEFSMGNDIADVNNDTYPDIITLDMLPEDNRRQKLLQGPENFELHRALVKNGFHYQFMRNMLHMNNGDGTFSEIGQLAGVSNTDWSWASLFADFDNDGFKDLFITNGYLRDYTNKDFLKYWGNYVVQKAMKMEKTMLMDLVKKMPSTLTTNYIYSNNGDLRFTNQTKDWGFAQPVLSSGAAYADLDSDGDLDLIINNVNQDAFIYRNNSTSKNFLDVRLSSNSKNKFGLGASVKIYHNGQVQTAEAFSVRGYQSSVTPLLHFGLNNNSVVDSVVVRWPTGNEQTVLNVKAGQTLNIAEASAARIVNSRSPSAFFKPASLVSFVHREFDYNDFKRQPLMPFMHSQVSPVLKSADVNHDGFEDLFIGASKGQASKLFLQQQDGSYVEQPVSFFEADKYFTASDAEFFDVDGDQDLDLYITSGGYHDYSEGNALLADRLYVNNGNGFFTERKTLPPLLTSKSCVSSFDFDKDDDLDLFLGGQVVPGRYPEAPRSYILENDGNGQFADVTNEVCPEAARVGMVTDAGVADLDRDGNDELVIVGEGMPVTVFTISGNRFSNTTSQFFSNSFSGLWRCIWMGDIDNDKDVDMLVGNVGLNSQLRATAQEPAELVYKDFDSNGSVDPFLCFNIQGVSYPYVTRDELLDQIYGMRKKFTSYESYANAKLSDIFLPDELMNAKKLTINHLETTLFTNDNGKFIAQELPTQAQYAPVKSIQAVDVNGDQKKDILLFGNDANAKLKLGRLSANYGTLLMNTGHNAFRYTSQLESGLQIKGDVKTTVVVETKDEKKLFVGINSGPLLTYTLRVPHE
jgi:enediyne biosynthesis protein E4